MEGAGGQAMDGFLADGLGRPLPALVYGAAETWIVGKAAGAGVADLGQSVADHPACDEVRDRGLGQKERAIAIDVMGVAELELAVDDSAGGRVTVPALPVPARPCRSS